MKKVDILLVDLLYQPKGSFDDDFATIAKSLEGKSIFHLKVTKNGSLNRLLQVITSLFQMSPRKVVFLSAKIWHLILLTPIALFCRTYAVYHFRPNMRAKMHDRALPLLSRVYAFAAYSESVREYLCEITGRDIPIVASRLIDKRRSFETLIKKLGLSVVNVFCPGIRSGVRMSMNYEELKRGVEQSLVRPVVSLVVQDCNRPFQSDRDVLTWAAPKLSEDEYARLFDEALIIAMNFYPGYEARSSAMINDALGRGCIVVTNAHPITFQYGYPRGLVTNLEHLPLVIEAVQNGSIGADQIPGFDYVEARKSWMEFLKLGV